VRSQVEEGNYGKIVAIDIETGAFEIAKDSLTASDRLLEQYPDAQIWLGRVGYRAVHRVGSGEINNPKYAPTPRDSDEHCNLTIPDV
jgi:hypothetical protein